MCPVWQSDYLSKLHRLASIEATRSAQATMPGWMPEERRMMDSMCPKCDELLIPIRGRWICVSCRHIVVPATNLDRRLEDGFALLNASEDERIDPNDHI